MLRKTMVERSAPLIQHDSLFNTVSDYVDRRMLYKVYRYMCNHGSNPEMPIQVWKDYTVDNETGLITNAIANCKLWTVEEFPLKSVIFYDENDAVFYTKEYLPTAKVLRDKISVETNVVLEHVEGDWEPFCDVGSGDIEVGDTHPFYVVVRYHGLNAKLEVGFPQDMDADDEKYLPNEYLDYKVKEFGLQRRTYKDGLTQLDGIKTYPQGYLDYIEQDYYLEKRLINEYRTNNNTQNYGYLALTSTDIARVSIKPFLFEVLNIDVITYISNSKYHVIVQDLDENYPDEMYSNSTLLDIIDDINTNSKLILLEIVATDETPEEEHLTLYQTGLFERFGLISAEIYQYLGVVPYIKNVTDYALRFDLEGWSGDKFGGDDWENGVFFVFIPVKNIPSNFNLLTQEELQAICNKCKPEGTKAIPMYIQDEYKRVNWR